MIARVANHDVWDLLVADGARKALVVVDVSGEHEFGGTAGCRKRGIERIAHRFGSAVHQVDGIRRVVQRDDKRSVGRRRLQFGAQPIGLRRF